MLAGATRVSTPVIDNNTSTQFMHSTGLSRATSSKDSFPLRWRDYLLKGLTSNDIWVFLVYGNHVWQMMTNGMRLDVCRQLLESEFFLVVSPRMLDSQREMPLVCSQGHIDDTLEEIQHLPVVHHVLSILLNADLELPRTGAKVVRLRIVPGVVHMVATSTAQSKGHVLVLSLVPY
jgi:hypothetical protein